MNFCLLDVKFKLAQVQLLGDFLWPEEVKKYKVVFRSYLLHYKYHESGPSGDCALHCVPLRHLRRYTFNAH